MGVEHNKADIIARKRRLAGKKTSKILTKRGDRRAWVPQKKESA